MGGELSPLVIILIAVIGALIIVLFCALFCKKRNDSDFRHCTEWVCFSSCLKNHSGHGKNESPDMSEGINESSSEPAFQKTMTDDQTQTTLLPEADSTANCMPNGSHVADIVDPVLHEVQPSCEAFTLLDTHNGASRPSAPPLEAL